jgi:hypothetical protein
MSIIPKIMYNEVYFSRRTYPSAYPLTKIFGPVPTNVAKPPTAAL